MTEKKKLIQKILNVFEAGAPECQYDKLVVYRDGIGRSKQITFGKHQTTEQGNLLTLIEMYVEREGSYSDDFVPYLELIGNTPLHEDEEFKNLLLSAAREDQIMRDTQDEFFDEVYWNPAMSWCERNQIQLSLSALVIYDSYIHSGQVLMFLRKRFIELPPSRGGDEKAWVSSYVNIRHQWLKYHSNRILRKTIYRTQTFINEIEKNNWNLDDLPIVANGVSVS
ncbi:chitosanase [Microbulbifer epialgicus]|uniref:Chitosanase n=1 Tax=Microbulbifer epialgicus TaxID=393907 RepID=A0ABV4P2J4_9GAMM